MAARVRADGSRGPVHTVLVCFVYLPPPPFFPRESINSQLDPVNRSHMTRQAFNEPGVPAIFSVLPFFFSLSSGADSVQPQVVVFARCVRLTTARRRKTCEYLKKDQPCHDVCVRGCRDAEELVLF